MRARARGFLLGYDARPRATRYETNTIWLLAQIFRHALAETASPNWWEGIAICANLDANFVFQHQWTLVIRRKRGTCASR